MIHHHGNAPVLERAGDAHEFAFPVHRETAPVAIDERRPALTKGNRHRPLVYERLLVTPQRGMIDRDISAPQGHQVDRIEGTAAFLTAPHQGGRRIGCIARRALELSHSILLRLYWM